MPRCRSFFLSGRLLSFGGRGDSGKEGLCEVARSIREGSNETGDPVGRPCVEVENTRFELVTSCMPCKRSSQLS